MCWVPLLVGTAMLLAGAVLVLRFFAGHGGDRPEVAGEARTESMILGGLLASIGLLLALLGVTGTVCGLLGIS